MQRRLERGRDLLRTRLAARGATLPAGLLVAALAPTTLDASVRAAILAAVFDDAASPSIVGLAGIGVGSLAGTKARLGACVALTVGLVIGGLGWHAAGQAPIGQDPPARQAAAAPAAGNERRDPFNDPLPAGAIARLGTLAFQHGGDVGALSFSADRKSLVSKGCGVIRRWQLDTGREIEQFDFRDPAALALKLYALTSDGQTIVLVRGQEHAGFAKVEVQESGSRKMLRQFTVTTTGAQYLSPDGSLLAVEQRDKLEIWSVALGRPTFTTPLGQPSFSDDGRTLVVCDHRQPVHVWDTATGTERKVFNRDSDSHSAQALSPDGKWLVTEGFTLGPPHAMGKGPDGKSELSSRQIMVRPFLRLWDIEKGELVGTIETGPRADRTFKFGPDSRTLIAIAQDVVKRGDSIKRWAIPARSLVGTWPQELSGDYRVAALSPNGRTVAASTSSGSIQLWDTATKTEFGLTDHHTGSIWRIVFEADGKTARTHSYDQTLIEWDIKSRKPLRRWREPDSGGGLIVYSANGRFRAVKPADPKVSLMVWDLLSDDRPFDVGPTDRYGPAPEVSNDGRRLTLIRADQSPHRLNVYDVRTGKLLMDWEIPTDDRTNSFIETLIDGTVAVLGRGRAMGYDGATGRELFRWDLVQAGGLKKQEEYGCVMRPSPDGRLMACFWPSLQGISLRDTRTGRVVRDLTYTGHVSRATFSADGLRLAAAINGPSPGFVLWDVKSGAKLAERTGHRGAINSLAFSPDGMRLVSGSTDCTALVWELASSVKSGPNQK